MKKIILITTCIIGIFSLVHGQNLYFRGGAGISLGTNANYDMIRDIDDTGNNDLEEIVPITLGKGVNAAGSIGYMFSKYIGVEMDFRYFYGFTTKSEMKGDDMLITTKVNGQMFQITPGICVSLGLKKFNPYGRIGIIVGVLPSIKQKVDIEGDFGKSVTQANTIFKMKGGFGLGVMVAAGLEFFLGNNLSLFGELDFSQISYAPRKGKFTKFDIDGEDQLSDLTTSEKEMEFVKKLDHNDPQPDYEPTKTLRSNFPFSHIGLNIGVKITL